MLVVPLVIALSAAHADCEEDLLLAPVHLPELADVAIVDYRLRSFVRQGPVFVVDLGLVASSVDGGAYGGVVATVVAPLVPGAVVDGEARFTHVPATGTVESDDTLQLRVPVTQAAAVAQWLNAVGFTFALSGDEIPQLQPWVRLVDEETDLAWDHETWDVDHVHWFAYETALVAQLVPGDVLLPEPDPTLGYTNLPWHPTVTFPDGDACDDFPARVLDVWVGDGTNGGDPGQVGVVFSPEEVPFQDIYTSYRVRKTEGNTQDGSVDGGPVDGYQSVQTEVGQEQFYCADVDGDGLLDPLTCQPRFCPQGLPEIDADGDPVTPPTDCDELYQSTPFTFSPAPGLEVAGSATVSSWSAQVNAKVRLGVPIEADLDLEMQLDTTLGLRAEQDVTLARTEAPIPGLPPLRVSVPTGVPGADFLVALEPYVGVEGNASARTQFGMVRRDTWTLDLHWDTATGSVTAGDHTVTTWPATSPELHSTAQAHVEVLVGADLSASVGVAGGLLSVGAELGGEAGLGLDVDSAASPWWEASTIGRIDLTGGVTGMGGLIDATAPPLTLVATDESLRSAPVGEVPGEAGTTSRWMHTLDFDPAMVDGTYGQRIAVHPAGGFVVTGTAWLHGYVSRLDALGQPIWTRQIPFSYGVVSVAPLSDGSVVVADDRCRWMSRLDADGTVLWQKDMVFANNGYGGSTCAVVPWVRPSDGVEGVVVAGTVAATLFDPYPAWGFVDTTGAVAWWRRLDTHGRLLGGTVLADGGLALVGETDVDCHALTNAQGYTECPDGGLVLRLDGEGMPVWGASVEGYQLVDIAETSTGRLLAVGKMTTYFWQPRHGLWLTALTPDGGVEWSSTYAQDVRWEGLSDEPVGTAPGDTQWDAGTAIEIVDDEVYLTGTTNTGLNRGSWVYRLTTDGVPVWQRLSNGTGDDGFGGLVVDGDALAVVGYTNALGGKPHGLVGRVPFDGTAELASSWGFDQRFTVTDVNDARDLVHVFWFLGGSATFTPIVVDQGLTPAVDNVVLAPRSAVSVDRSW